MAIAEELPSLGEARRPAPAWSAARSGEGLGLRGALRSHLSETVLVALVVGLYAPVAGFDFVNWDDPWYVVENPLIRSWHPENLRQIAFGIHIKNYAPLVLFAYLVQHALWGMWAGGYHLANVALHAVATVLAGRLVARTTGRAAAGWIAAALFAVHPVQVESVAWISSQKGLWNAVFSLAALWYWLKADRTDRDQSRGLLWYVAALLTKALAVVLPAVVLAYDVLVRRESFARAARRQVVPGLLAVGLLGLTMFAQETEFGGVRGHMGLGRLHLLAVDATILWRYVGLLVAPRDLCVLYDPPVRDIAGHVAAALVGWGAIAWGAWRVRRSFPLVPWALATSLLLLLPVLNLFPITTLMNDRYLYLPALPLFGLFAAGVVRAAEGMCATACRFANRTERGPNVLHAEGTVRAGRSGFVLACALTAPLLCVLGAATMRQIEVWRGPEALWTHAMSHAGQLPVVRIQWANTLRAQDRTDEACAVLRATLTETEPDRFDRERIERKLRDWNR